MTTNNTINANSTSPLAIINGGSGVNAVTTAPAASAFAGWDANKNLTANNNIESYATTATTAATTTLTVASAYQQFFTGSTTQTVVLPVTSTLVLGQSFLVVNNSSGVVTVQSSGANTVTAMAAGTQAIFTCILTSGTTAASWNSDYSLNTVGVASITGTANQVIASASTGAVTLTLPQSIATTSSPTFASPTFTGNAILGTPASGTLTNCTGLPIATGVSGLGTGVGTALATATLGTGGNIALTASSTTWTPVFTFATPGNISVVYTVQQGYYSRVGNIITASFYLNFTPTYTSSSGAVQLTGLPVAANSSITLQLGPITLQTNTFPAGVTNIYCSLPAGGTLLNIQGCGSATAAASFSTAQFLTATAYVIQGTITYQL